MLLNVAVVPSSEEPKIDGEEPKEGVVEALKRDEEEPAPNGGVGDGPNIGAEADVVLPKALEDVPKGELNARVVGVANPEGPNVGVFRPNGLKGIVLEKGFAAVRPNVLLVPKGLDCDGAAKPIPLVGCLAGLNH